MRATLRGAALAALFVAAAHAQDPEAPPQQLLLEERLSRLDARGTDWLQLLDVGDKVEALGAAAVPVVQRAGEAAREREDKRYALRLLGVLARVDASGLQQLGTFAAHEHGNTAAVAARVLGRCGARREAVGKLLLELLRTEKRPIVASAIAMAAADANAQVAAPELRKWLEAGTLEPGVAAWFQIALAAVTDEPPKTLRDWITSDGPLAGAALLAARRHRDPDLTRLLLERLADRSDEKRWSWLVQSLGASGDPKAHSALFASLAASLAEQKADGAFVISSEVDPRRLALMRLGDSASLTWARNVLVSNSTDEAPGGATMQMLTPELVRVPALLGKWQLPNAAKVLHAGVQNRKLAKWLRIQAARGLCWLRDARGLTALADLLAAPPPDQFEFGIPDAQATLHEFVGNADRPDYRRIELDDRTTQVEVGAQWQQWLGKHAAKLQWRELTWVDDDMLLWR